MPAKAPARPPVGGSPPPAPEAAESTLLGSPWRVPALGVVTAVWVGLLVAWAYLSYAHTPTLVSLGGDSAVYALTARYFQSLLSGPVDPVAAMAAAQSLYPPLHPLLLALVGAGRGDSWLAGNTAVTVALLLALAVFYLWLCRRNLPWGAALAATLALALMPGVWRQTVLLQSENLYLLATLAALAWLEGPGRGARRLVMTPTGAAMSVPWTERVGLAPGLVFVALAMLTRTAGMALLAGVLAAWTWGRLAPAVAWRAPLAGWRPGKVLLGLGLAALPLVLWNLVHRPEASYATSLAQSYGEKTGGLGSALLAQSRVEIAALVEAWPGLFGLPARLGWLAWAVAALGAGGLAWRAARGRADGWYVGAYLALLVVWPYPAEAERFLLVILPVVWAAALEGPMALVAWARRRPGAVAAPVASAAGHPGLVAGLVAGALLLAVVPGALLAAQAWFAARPVAGRPGLPPDWRHRPVWYVDIPLETRIAIAAEEDGYRDMHASLAALTPADACVLSPKPPLSMVYGHRPAWALPRPALDADAFRAEVRRRNCRYALSMAAATPTYPALYPLTRLTGVTAVRPLPAGRAPVGYLVSLSPSAGAPPP